MSTLDLPGATLGDASTNQPDEDPQVAAYYQGIEDARAQIKILLSFPVGTPKRYITSVVWQFNQNLERQGWRSPHIPHVAESDRTEIAYDFTIPSGTYLETTAIDYLRRRYESETGSALPFQIARDRLHQVVSQCELPTLVGNDYFRPSAYPDHPLGQGGASSGLPLTLLALQDALDSAIKSSSPQGRPELPQPSLGSPPPSIALRKGRPQHILLEFDAAKLLHGITFSPHPPQGFNSLDIPSESPKRSTGSQISDGYASLYLRLSFPKETDPRFCTLVEEQFSKKVADNLVMQVSIPVQAPDPMAPGHETRMTIGIRPDVCVKDMEPRAKSYVLSRMGNSLPNAWRQVVADSQLTDILTQFKSPVDQGQLNQKDFLQAPVGHSLNPRYLLPVHGLEPFIILALQHQLELAEESAREVAQHHGIPAPQGDRPCSALGFGNGVPVYLTIGESRAEDHIVIQPSFSRQPHFLNAHEEPPALVAATASAMPAMGSPARLDAPPHVGSQQGPDSRRGFFKGRKAAVRDASRRTKN